MDNISREQMLEELTQYYESAGFNGIDFKLLRSMNMAQLKYLYEEYVSFNKEEKEI